MDEFRFAEMTFEFPLIFLPCWDIIEDHVRCVVFDLNDFQGRRIANQIIYDQKLERIRCTFRDFAEKDKLYFAVISN